MSLPNSYNKQSIPNLPSGSIHMEVLTDDKLGYWNNLISLFFKACEYCIKGFGSELRTIMHKNYRTVTKSFMSGDGFIMLSTP